MSAQPRPVRPIEPHVPQAGGVRLRWEDATTTDGKQSVLPEMTNHTPVRSDELRIDFERRSIDTQTYATAVGAGGKRVCVRQGFMALRVRSSLSCSTCVCEMTTLRSRIHTESTRGSAVPILANMFVYRCHFGNKLRKLEKFRFTHPPLPRYFTNFPLLPVCESTDWETIGPPRNDESHSCKE